MTNNVSTMSNGVKYTYDGITYRINDDGKTATVINCDKNCTGSKNILLSIPYGCNSFKVTKIGDRSFQFCSITSVTIPDSVTSIGNWAFQGCSNLESVEFPSTIDSIGDHAFSGCSSLLCIDISNKVTIGNYAFSGCNALIYINITNPNSCLGDYALLNCNRLFHAKIPQRMKANESKIFAGCNLKIEKEDEDRIYLISFNDY